MKHPEAKFLAVDKNEAHMRRLHEKAITVCREHNATLDLATSDNSVYIEHANKETAELIQSFYPGSRLAGHIGNRWEIY